MPETILYALFVAWQTPFWHSCKYNSLWVQLIERRDMLLVYLQFKASSVISIAAALASFDDTSWSKEYSTIGGVSSDVLLQFLSAVSECTQNTNKFKIVNIIPQNCILIEFFWISLSTLGITILLHYTHSSCCSRYSIIITHQLINKIRYNGK